MGAYRSSVREEPIRLFRSDFLEFFSHMSPWVVAAIWTPIIVFFIASSLMQTAPGWSLLYAPLGILLGWFAWTLVEYAMHRFVFHYHAKSERLKRLVFIMHGVHHAQPMCRTRLVMPPAVSLPMAIIFYGFFQLLIVRVIGARAWFDPVFAGFVGGYLVYDLMHYAIHHAAIKSGPFLAIRNHHLRHHGRHDFMRFGVTFPLGDYAFGIMPKGD